LRLERGQERQAWIALAATKGVGGLTLERARSRYGSFAAALSGIAALSIGGGDRRLSGALRMRVPAGLQARITASAGDPGAAEREMAKMNGWILTPFDIGYRRWLHQIEEPPPLIYGIGSADRLASSRGVAVVGTRRPSSVGRALASKVATRLVETEAVVVSGLAVGIDAAAHAAAIEAHGSTVAVVGGGLDAPGPALNARLADSIIESGGAIVSEHRPGVRATRGTFPRCNRIISALTLGTIVIEAPARSGALITARHALEQGRRLLVAPGRPGDPTTAGCLAFLRETPARLLVGLDEMIVDLGLDAALSTPSRGAGDLSAATALGMLSPTQRRIAEALMAGPQPVDSMVATLGLDAGVVAAALTLLQLRGWAQAHGSMHLSAGPLARSR
jgi:DNA processing protein